MMLVGREIQGDCAVNSSFPYGKRVASSLVSVLVVAMVLKGHPFWPWFDDSEVD